MKTKEQQLVQAARKLAATAATWADFSNALFDPETGIVAKAYRNRTERQKFMKTKEYREIQDLVDEVEDRTGLIEGATPRKKSGKFMVRVPVTLHAALEAEAREEGVSLNQLVVTKLAMRVSKKFVA